MRDFADWPRKIQSVHPGGRQGSDLEKVLEEEVAERLSGAYRECTLSR